MLVFSHSKDFHDLYDSFIYFLSAALGNYDIAVFEVKVTDDEINDERVYNALVLGKFGVFYMIVYLFVNMVLMLNMVIAILAEVFGKYSE
jgi:predicted permease